MSRLIGLLILTAFPLAGFPALAMGDDSLPVDKTGTLEFNRDIRPILSDHCYACHGPDERMREADLRFDQPASAVGSLENNAAIVPGKPDSSRLVSRIFSDDPDEIMPPPHLNKPLTIEEKKRLVRWISEGAKYQLHWSFSQPVRGALPGTNEDWPKPRNAIDHFILAALEKNRLRPAPTAQRRVLIRRVTLDLTGLPPRPAEVEAFVQDSSPNAYERVVDRLMKSKDYAERRAQDWLDLARYADTRGFADDKTRAIWPWRDWVVRAIDDNMPFDQFTVEQLAGDMLPDASAEQILATAFHRNAPQAKGMTYPVEEYRIQGVIDRVNTIGRVWLGLTLDCVECHDHKFDPITQADYYSVFAIFNNIEHGGSGFDQGGPVMNYHLTNKAVEEKRQAKRRKLLSELARVRMKLPDPQPIDDKKIIGKWTRPTVVKDPQEFSLTGDLTITARIRTTQPVADIVSKYDWRGQQRGFVFGIGGEKDKDSLPGRLFFWVSSKAKNFDGVTVTGSQLVNDGREHLVAVEFVAGKSVRLFVDGMEDRGARFKGQVPATIAQSNRSLAIGSGYHNSVTPNAFQLRNGLIEVRLSDQALGSEISIGEAGTRAAALLTELGQLEIQNPAHQVIRVPVMRELETPRKTHIHERGNFLAQGQQVFPAVPALFQLPKDRQPRNRLEFARWLVDGENPLVARVVVNRFWQTYFGQGLVRTPDDFGAQGMTPTHPRLLDWLAAEFVSSGWNMKHMHRLIVTSDTYRRSAVITSAITSSDPQNLLLARMSRLRLPAEQIRDQALAVSGLLIQQAGGPPVYPLQPEGYWQTRVLPGEWKNSIGGDRHRKTIYTYWRRMALHPTLDLLDAPARENCVIKRDISNIPTQALVLLNDPIFHEAATAFAGRIIDECPADDRQRLNYAFRLALSRPPDAAERKRFLSYLADQREKLNNDRKAARTLSKSTTNSHEKIEMVLWTLACSVILNLDETITRP